MIEMQTQNSYKTTYFEYHILKNLMILEEN